MRIRIALSNNGKYLLLYSGASIIESLPANRRAYQHLVSEGRKLVRESFKRN